MLCWVSNQKKRKYFDINSQMSLTECWLLLDGHRRICWSTYHIAGIDLPHQEAKIQKKLTAWEETKLQQPSLAQPLSFSPYLFSHGGQAAMFSLAAFFIDAMRTKNSITRPSIKLEVQHSQRSQNQIESFPNTFENTLPTISFGIQHGSPFSPLSLLNNCKKAQNHYVTKLIHTYPLSSNTFLPTSLKRIS